MHALVGRARAQGQPLGSIAGVERPGIVHRLDKDTSGLLLVAKSDAAQASLMAQFGDRSIDKEYLALVHGEPPAPRGRIEAPVGRDPRNRQRMAVVSGGREAVTEYQKILQHRGVDPFAPVVPLAQLGIARSYALSGDIPASRRAYEELFAIWKGRGLKVPPSMGV